MTQEQALKLIDDHRNIIVTNPVTLPDWTWLMVIVHSIEKGAWERAVVLATEVLVR